MQGNGKREVIYEFGGFVVDPNEKSLHDCGTPIHLPSKEFEMLVLMIENNGRALSKEEMLSTIWQGAFVEEGNIAKNVSRLRKVLDTNGSRHIETIPKHGYRFTADVKLVDKADSGPVVLERRTIKRLTFSVDESPALALAARRRWVAIPVLVAVVVGLAYGAWVFSSSEDKVVDPYEPLRLTDNPNHDTGPVWMRDGRIRFHRLASEDRGAIVTINADGTGESEIPQTDDKYIFSWSPDEKKIVFLRHDDPKKAYLANADGSGEVLLPARGGTWSEDSKMLAYRAQVDGDNHDIFVYWVETGEIRNITNNEFFDADPAFSPDGKQIVFVSIRDGNGEIYSSDLDGGNVRRLTSHPSVDSHPTYSPDGTAILFNSDRENENSDVYMMRADGTGSPQKITTFDKSNETAGPGSWSPDGTQIAFFSDRNGKDDIYVMRAESIRPRLVYEDPEQDIGACTLSPDQKKIAFSRALKDLSGELRIFDTETERTTLVTKTELSYFEPAWSPAGDKIAFYDRIDGNSEIMVVNADGSGYVSLTNDPSKDVSPSWSPDGTRIVFLSYRGNQRQVPQIYSMDADGRDPRPVKSVKDWDADPVWSAGGDSVFFSCDKTDVPGNLMDICRIGVDGTGEARILSRRNQDRQPAVSPDGRRIAFVASSDGNAEIYIMNVDGSDLLRLTRHEGEDVAPVWSADGRRIFFISDRSGRSAIYEAEVP